MNHNIVLINITKQIEELILLNRKINFRQKWFHFYRFLQQHFSHLILLKFKQLYEEQKKKKLKEKWIIWKNILCKYYFTEELSHEYGHLHGLRIQKQYLSKWQMHFNSYHSINILKSSKHKFSELNLKKKWNDLSSKYIHFFSSHLLRKYYYKYFVWPKYNDYFRRKKLIISL